jgi:hypothetical protein
MRRWFRWILCGLSLLVAAGTVGIWIYVAFYHRQQFVWQREREYCLTLEAYAYRLDVLRCEQAAGEVYGDLMLMRAGSMPVPMRGVEHYSMDRHGHGFYVERAHSWPAVNPAWPLPPPVPLAGGGVLRTELRVQGVLMGVPYWFVTALGLAAPLWAAGRWGAAFLRGRNRMP